MTRHEPKRYHPVKPDAGKPPVLVRTDPAPPEAPEKAISEPYVAQPNRETGEADYREVAEARPLMVQALPADYVETRPPLVYRLTREAEPSRPVGRIGQSRIYRARAFSTGIFYKPISRYLEDW